LDGEGRTYTHTCGKRKQEVFFFAADEGIPRKQREVFLFFLFYEPRTIPRHAAALRGRLIRQNSREELSQNPSLSASWVGRLPTCGKRACEYINECFQNQKINFEKKKMLLS
jgi:hypothetical protein